MTNPASTRTNALQYLLSGGWGWSNPVSCFRSHFQPSTLATGLAVRFQVSNLKLPGSLPFSGALSDLSCFRFDLRVTRRTSVPSVCALLGLLALTACSSSTSSPPEPAAPTSPSVEQGAFRRGQTGIEVRTFWSQGEDAALGDAKAPDGAKSVAAAQMK